MKLTSEEQAQRAFATAESALKALGWNYDVSEKASLVINTGVQGDNDLPIPMIVRVWVEKSVLLVASPIDHEVTDETDETIKDLLLAMAILNDNASVGNFEYQAENRTVWFRISTYFRDSELSSDAVAHLLYAAASCVNEHNGKLLLLMNGLMPIEEFYTAVKAL